MKDKISTARWKLAQIHEKGYWAEWWKHRQAKAGKAYWNGYLRLLEKLCDLREARILDIGCGPDGMVNYINGYEKCALDSLMDYYLKNFDMPKDVIWIKGVSEFLPFKNNSFDLIITTNTLDHMHDPGKALTEINRVLKSRGILFLTVTCYSPLVRHYRALREKVRVGDVFHLYSFLAKDVFKMISENGFCIINVKKNPVAWRNILLSCCKERNIKRFISNIIKAILSFIWRKISYNTFDRDYGMYIFIATKPT